MLAAPLAGCLKEETGIIKNSGSGSSSVTIPGNDEIEAGIFEDLNLEDPALAGVKAHYEGGRYYQAAAALLEYYRARVDVDDPEIDLLNPTITEEQQQVADWALKDNAYRFQVEGYADSANDNAPYSYKGSGDTPIKWDYCPSKEDEQRYGVHRLSWMLPQALAYRVTRDERYVTGQVDVFTDWVAAIRPQTAEVAEGDETVSVSEYAWRNKEVAGRIGDLCSAMIYSMQSVNFTPQYLALYLTSLVDQVEYLEQHPSADESMLKKEASAIRRMGMLFPELKRASEWTEGASDMLNKDIDPKWFEAVNLDFAGFAGARAAYEAGEYYAAAEIILNYYRTRSGVVNPNVDLANTTVTVAEQAWADQALEENGYRFYIKNFLEDSGNNVPYSFLSSETGRIDWMYMPTSKTEQELRYQLNRHQWMLPQAKAYYLSKDARYIRNWMFVFSDWFEQNPRPEVDLDYSVYPDNQSPEYRRAGWTWRPLDVAARVIDECSVWEYYKEAPELTSTFMLKYLYHFAQQVDHIVKFYSADSNHRITQAQSVAFAGVLMPELKNASEWVSSGTGVLNGTIESEYFADGWLKDGDFSYHISSIEDFRSTMELATLNGRTDCITEANIAKIRKMCDVVMWMVYPNYSSVNMGDTRNAAWSKSMLKRNFSRYVGLFPDSEELRYMSTEGKEGAAPVIFPTTGSPADGIHHEQKGFGIGFEHGGYYVLRTGWDANATMMVLHNPGKVMAGQWHVQNDNGTFELMVKGRQFFPDSGCYTYTTGSNRNKYAATAAHNTLTLDGKNSACDGRMLRLDYNSSTSADRLVLVNNSYGNLSHRRLVYLIDKQFVVLVDEAKGSASGTLNLNFHLADEAKEKVTVVLDPEQMGFHTTSSDGNNLMARTFAFIEGEKSNATTPAFTEKEGFVSYQTDTSTARKAYSIDVEKSADTNVRFITVLYPAADDNHTITAASSGAFTDARSSVKVTIDGKEHVLTNTNLTF